MTSTARTEANRRNAAKSTGPRTTEGKARSRFNALKHGLRAEEIVLPTESATAFDAHITAWMGDWQPPTETRRFLVERAAVAAWRLGRCVRAESERLTRRVNQAMVAWDAGEDADLDAAVALLADDPASALATLGSTRLGINRLIGLWNAVVEAVDFPDAWADLDDHHGVLVNLLGSTIDDDDEATRDLATASWRLIVRNDPEIVRDEDAVPLGDDEVNAARSLIVTTAIEHLAALQARWAATRPVTAERGRYAEMVAFEPRPEDAPFQRYEARHDREARAAIGLLLKLDKSDADLGGLESIEAEAEPIAPNEPNDPAVSSPSDEPGPVPDVPLPNEPKAGPATTPRHRADRGRECPPRTIGGGTATVAEPPAVLQIDM